LDSRPAHFTSARRAMDAGLVLVTEDRKRLGLILGLGVDVNLTLSALAGLRRGPFVDRDRELAATREMAASLRIKAHALDGAVGMLSGGNQQKVVIGKALFTRPTVLLLDEPTRGIDIGARLEIYQLMNRLAGEGTAIVMVSSELPELIGMSDRILMLHEGRVGGVFARAEATEAGLLAAAMGRDRHAA
jgi:D-xylose transport system ATP-binding protein